MKKKTAQLNKPLRLLCVLFCLLALTVTAAAAETGSLRVDVDGDFAGITLTLYHVADVDGTLTEECAGAGLTAEQMLSEAERPTCAAALYSYVMNNQLSGTEAMTDEGGIAFFPDLSEGIYLVWGESDRVEFSPFLVAIPTVVGDLVIYDVEAFPKAETPGPDPTPEPTPTPSGPPDIPQTGVVIWPVYLLLALGVLTLAAGVTVLVRGRKGKDE